MTNKTTVITEPPIENANNSLIVISLYLSMKPMTMPEKTNLPISYMALLRFFLRPFATVLIYQRLKIVSKGIFRLKTINHEGMCLEVLLGKEVVGYGVRR